MVDVTSEIVKHGLEYKYAKKRAHKANIVLHVYTLYMETRVGVQRGGNRAKFQQVYVGFTDWHAFDTKYNIKKSKGAEIF